MEIGDEAVTGVVGNTDLVTTTPNNTRAQYIYWCFTLNNHNDGDGDKLKRLFDEGCLWYRFQEERGAKGTPHLQGVCCFKGKMRLKQLKDYYSRYAHWEPSRSAAANDYCRKEDTATGKYWEKLDKLAKPKKTIKKPILTKKIEYETLRQNQKEIADLYNNPCSEFNRIINWYWENEGNWGKTYLVKYLIDNCGAIMLSGGSKDAVNGIFSYIKETETVPNIIIFDIPRCNEGHVSYNAIEQIKNGCIFNSKYETGMLRFDTPHIIVFANEEPEYTKLSRDRWNVVELGVEKRKDKIIDYYKTI